MQTRCQHSQRLRGHGVSAVNDYPDTDKTMRTLLKNFKGFSQILKEQCGEKMYLGVLQPNSNSLKICKRPYLEKNLRVRLVVD